MRMRVFMKKLRVKIENETIVYLESLDFEIEMRVSQKSELYGSKESITFGHSMLLNNPKSPL